MDSLPHSNSWLAICVAPFSRKFFQCVFPPPHFNLPVLRNWTTVTSVSLTLPSPFHATPPHALLGLSQTQNIGFWLSMSLVTSLVSHYPPQFLARQAPPWQLASIPHKSSITHQFTTLLISVPSSKLCYPLSLSTEWEKGSGATAHGCIFYLPPSSIFPSHVTKEHNSLRVTKQWWRPVMRMINYPWGANSSFWCRVTIW